MNSATINIVFKGNASGVTSSMNGLTKSITLGNIAAKAITKTLGIMTNSLGDAVERYDTLNNFPKVMKNLGVSTKDSTEAINEMSDKLQGLPTTLNDGASAVQRFTSKNGDVKTSTKMFLALNNAILAGGASTDIQSSALEQLSQAYSKGKMDMMEWRTLQMAMPAQLNQVAQAMGISTDALGSGLRDGSISMDKFMQSIMQLNTKGVGEFASFEEQAKGAIGGIGTSITNLKTSITRGLTSAIEGLNTGLKKANLPSISEIIVSIGKKINKLFQYISQKLPSIISFIIKIAPILYDLLPVIIGVMTAFSAFTKIISIMEGVSNALTLIAKHPIVLLIAVIIGIIAALVVLYTKCEKFRKAVQTGFAILKKIFTPFFNMLKIAFGYLKKALVELWAVLKPIVDKLKEFIMKHLNLLKPLLIGLVAPIALIVAGLVVFALGLAAIIKKITQVIKAMSNFVKSAKTTASNIVSTFAALPAKIVAKLKSLPTKIKNIFTSIGSKFKSIGSDILDGIWSGIKGAWGGFKSKLSGLKDKMVKAMKKQLEIGSPSRVMADQIGQFIPSGISQGIDDNASSVYKSLGKLSNGLTTAISPNVASSTALNNSPVVNVVVNSTYETDPLGQVVRKTKNYAGGAKNSYNYGMGV